MKELLHFLLSNLVDNTDAIKIETLETENHTVQLTIHVDQPDIGKVIGKEGKTIRAIRNVIGILALKHNQYVNVVLAE